MRSFQVRDKMRRPCWLWFQYHLPGLVRLTAWFVVLVVFFLPQSFYSYRETRHQGDLYWKYRTVLTFITVVIEVKIRLEFPGWKQHEKTKTPAIPLGEVPPTPFAPVDSGISGGNLNETLKRSQPLKSCIVLPNG